MAATSSGPVIVGDDEVRPRGARDVERLLGTGGEGDAVAVARERAPDELAHVEQVVHDEDARPVGRLARGGLGQRRPRRDAHAPPRRHLGHRLARRLRLARRGVHDGQLDPERAARALLRIDARGPAHRLRELFRERETEPRAFVREREPLAGVHLREELEEAPLPLLGDARPVVLHRNARAPRARGDRQRDCLALRRVLQRVREEVEDDLLERVRLDVHDARCVLGRLHGEDDPLRLARRREVLPARARERRRVDGRQVPLLLARRELLEVEELVHEAQEPPRVLDRDVDARLAREDRLAAHLVERVQDERERRAELVGDVLEEVRLLAIELDELGGLIAELLCLAGDLELEVLGGFALDG
jgi:hypothetical protein